MQQQIYDTKTFHSIETGLWKSVIDATTLDEAKPQTIENPG